MATEGKMLVDASLKGLAAELLRSIRNRLSGRTFTDKDGKKYTLLYVKVDGRYHDFTDDLINVYMGFLPDEDFQNASDAEKRLMKEIRRLAEKINGRRYISEEEKEYLLEKIERASTGLSYLKNKIKFPVIQAWGFTFEQIVRNDFPNIRLLTDKMGSI